MILYSTFAKKIRKFSGSSIFLFLTLITGNSYSQNVGIGITLPSAALHIKAGTSSTPPLLLTNGNLTSTIRDGSIEYDGINFYLSTGGSRNSIAVSLNGGFAFLDFPSTPAQTSYDLALNLTGAIIGDAVIVTPPPISAEPNSNYTAWVSSTNTVTVRFNNYSVSTIDPQSGTFRVTIIK